VLTHATIDHLRERRNAIVHHGTDTTDAFVLASAVKAYIEALIDFNLRSRRTFATLKEVAEYLDLPPDVGKLQRLMALHRRAYRFRQPVKRDTAADANASNPTPI